MWRWVTRGLVLTFVALLAPLLFAQRRSVRRRCRLSGSGARSTPGVVLVKGWALDPDSDLQDRALGRRSVPAQGDHVPAAHRRRAGLSGLARHPHRAARIHRPASWPAVSRTVRTRSRCASTPATATCTPLGRRTININNTINQAPFGCARHPGRRAASPTLSGAFPVVGWAADTRRHRADRGPDRRRHHAGRRSTAIRGRTSAHTFPDFTGAAFSGFVANIDSTRLQNGVHLLTSAPSTTQGCRARSAGARCRSSTTTASSSRSAISMSRSATPCSTAPAAAATPADVRSRRRSTSEAAHHRRSAAGRSTSARAATPAASPTPSCSSTACAGCRPTTAASSAGRFANCYGLPRYDVARYYPTFPDAPRAGFLFTLDVGALLNLGVRPGQSHPDGARRRPRADVHRAAEPRRHPGLVPVRRRRLRLLGHRLHRVPDDVRLRQRRRHCSAAGRSRISSSVAAVEVFIDGNFVGRGAVRLPAPRRRRPVPAASPARRNSGWMLHDGHAQARRTRSTA